MSQVAASELRAASAADPTAEPTDVQPRVWRSGAVVDVAVRRAAAIAAAITFVFQLATTRRSYFFMDDYWWFHQARTSAFDMDYLRVGNYGHFAPATRAAYYVYHAFAGMRWIPASLIISTLVALIVLSVASLARELGAHRLAAAGAGLFVGLSPAFVHVAQWWGASVHMFLALLGTIWTAVFFLRWQRTGSKRFYAASVAGMLGGLLVQERPVLVVCALALFALVPPSAGWSRRSLKSAALHVAPFVVIALGYLAFVSAEYDAGQAPRAPISDWSRFLARALFVDFGPLTASLQPARLGSEAVIFGTLALIVWGLVVFRFRNGATWQTIALIAGMWFANFVILGYGRLGINGTAIADDLQYHVDAVVWFAAPIAALLSGRCQRPRHAGFRREGSILIAAIVVLTTFTAPRVLANEAWAWVGRSARQYMEPVSAGSGMLSNLQTRWQFLNLNVPAGIFPAWVPLTQSQMFDLFGSSPMQAPNAPLVYAFDGAGNVREVRPLYTDVVDFADTEAPTRVTLGDVIAEPSSADSLCVRGTGGSPVIKIALDPTAVAQATALDLHYTSSASFTALIATERGADVSIDRVEHVYEGTWQLLAPVPLAGASTLAISGPPLDQTLCLQSMSLFAPVAQPLPRTSGCELLGFDGAAMPTSTCGEEWRDGGAGTQ